VPCGGFAIACAATTEVLARERRSSRHPQWRKTQSSWLAWLSPSCVLALAVPLADSQAYELVTVEAHRDGAVYQLRVEALFDAPPERLLRVLTDYNRLHELHPQIISSRSFGPVGPATEEVHTSFEGCVLFFCRTVTRAERILLADGSLFGEDIPDRGSFSEGRSEWRLSVEGEGTRLRYETRFVPAFRVPPMLGPAMLARIVERLTVETMAEAEKRAQVDDAAAE
jgi:hypothetical protein